MATLDQDFLDAAFPAQRTDDFFDALFGGAEEGAYDIRLVCRNVTPDRAVLAFELRRRPGKGLPQVFQRHPVLNVAGVAKAVAARLGWPETNRWSLEPTEEISHELHAIPLVLERP